MADQTGILGAIVSRTLGHPLRSTFRRLPLETRQAIKYRLGLGEKPPPRRDPRHRDDDFNWRDYTRHYQPQVDEGEKRWRLRIAPGDYAFGNERVVKTRDVNALHPVVWVLYEAILKLAPRSVLDVGCGSGDNLANLRLLRPDLELFGCDISEGQLEFAAGRHSDLGIDLVRRDLTLAEEIGRLPEVDLAFCKTVVMHIRTADTHEDALCNLLLRARNQAVLMENWERHAFLDDYTRLRDTGRLPWPNAHFYYHAREGTAGPHAMIVSREPLDDFPELTDYGVMTYA